jgi:hypothetical protein
MKTGFPDLGVPIPMLVGDVNQLNIQQILVVEPIVLDHQWMVF